MIWWSKASGGPDENLEQTSLSNYKERDQHVGNKEWLSNADPILRISGTSGDFLGI